jgi:hypothetical protein
MKPMQLHGQQKTNPSYLNNQHKSSPRSSTIKKTGVSLRATNLSIPLLAPILKNYPPLFSRSLTTLKIRLLQATTTLLIMPVNLKT